LLFLFGIYYFQIIHIHGQINNIFFFIEYILHIFSFLMKNNWNKSLDHSAGQ